MPQILRYLRYSLFAVIWIVALLLIVAATGDADSRVFEKYFPTLLIVNLIFTVVLFVFVASLIFRLVQRWRKKQFGSKMTAMLALTMAATTMLPCLLIYFISNQFLGHSIDSWFDVRVEQALESGVTLSGQILDREQRRLLSTARRIGRSLTSTSETALAETLAAQRKGNDLTSAAVVSSLGFVLFSDIDEESKANTESLSSPPPSEFKYAREQNGFATLDGDTEEDLQSGLHLRALVPLRNAKENADEKNLRYLLVTQSVPSELSRNISSLAGGYRDYQELNLSREALQSIYQVTLTLTMLLALLGAIAVALGFASRTTAPIRQLAVGTKKVARGELHPIAVLTGSSELNELTESFNAMVSEISEARSNVEKQRQAAEHSRAYLGRILTTLSSGVIVVTEELAVVMANTAAATLLQRKNFSVGNRLQETVPEFADAVKELIRVSEGTDFRTELTLHHGTTNDIPDTANEHSVTLFVRGSRLALNARLEGWVLVFDDMSTVIDAQRALAWGEVARRLAHEIKNPLTPIRLAAERMAMKLADKLDGHDKSILQKGCATIVGQVDAMKSMVNDFRDYAKLPNASLVPTDAAAFFTELATLYRSAGIDLTTDFGDDLPLVPIDKTQIRQLVHNLVGNAMDATAGQKDPRITLALTEVRASSSATPTAVKLTVEDNGPGFAPNILSKAFEPYITTKETGTGLGLPMVKKIAEEHRAKISIENKLNNQGDVIGARIQIVFPTAV